MTPAGPGESGPVLVNVASEERGRELNWLGVLTLNWRRKRRTKLPFSKGPRPGEGSEASLLRRLWKKRLHWRGRGEDWRELCSFGGQADFLGRRCTHVPRRSTRAREQRRRRRQEEYSSYPGKPCGPPEPPAPASTSARNPSQGDTVEATQRLPAAWGARRGSSDPRYTAWPTYRAGTGR